MEHIQYKLITTTKRIALICGPLFFCSILCWDGAYHSTLLPVPQRVGPLREGNAPKEGTRFCDESLRLHRGADEEQLVTFFGAFPSLSGPTLRDSPINDELDRT